jgi:hypothetical protein
MIRTAPERAILILIATALASGCEAEPERNMTVNEVAAELAGLRISPGLWESSSRLVDVTAPNLPREMQNRMKARASTIRHCITPEQAARPDANFLATRQDNCTYQQFSMRDGRLEGRMTCSGGELPGPATALMEGEYGPDRYDMRMRMEIAGPADSTMTIQTRASGRRIGDCPQSEETKK